MHLQFAAGSELYAAFRAERLQRFAGAYDKDRRALGGRKHVAGEQRHAGLRRVWPLVAIVQNLSNRGTQHQSHGRLAAIFCAASRGPRASDFLARPPGLDHGQHRLQGRLSVGLRALRATVSGFSLPPEGKSFYDICGLARFIETTPGDVRDLEAVRREMLARQPEVVFHMAAQPLVLRSRQQPVETFATNVLGTIHLLEAIRFAPSVRAVVIVSNDNCYQNRSWL
jgi:hypothetical protein